MIPHRLAQARDLDDIMAVVAQARRAIAALGIDQWQDGYPERALIEQDIARGIGYVFLNDGIIAGYLALDARPEPVYAQIEGAWLTDGKYLTVHRSCAGDGSRGRGLGTQMLQFAEAFARERGAASVRADTHRGNAVMRHLLEKRGYSCCGTVKYDVTAGDPLRVAYEKRVATNLHGGE